MTVQDAAAGERSFDLHQAFLGREAELLAALETGRRNAGHPGVQGQGTEMHWQALLEAVLQARYKVSSAIVVDSEVARASRSTWSSGTGTSPRFSGSGVVTATCQ